jgi:cytochrome c-type biogenesis protein CcmE
MDGSFGSEAEASETSDALERAKSGGAADEPRAPAPPGGSRGTIKGIIVIAVLGAIVSVLLLSTNAFVYSETLSEVAARPAEHATHTLRVEGRLQNGSIRFREDPCEWRFVLEEEGRTMPVEFSQCVVPDTFRDGMGITVVVEGRIREDGSFVASQVIPRCPSRYEMEQRQQAGETMPHAAPPAEPPS